MYYKKCIRCNGEFSSKRKNRESISFNQFSTIKYCSVKCRNSGKQKSNNIFCKEGVCYLTATNTKNVFLFDERFKTKINEYCWHENAQGYLRSQFLVTRKVLFLHHLIIGKKKGLVVDHIDRDKKNNLPSNLRLITQQENAINSSIRKGNRYGCSGIGYQKNRKNTKPYFANLKYKGKTYRSRYFGTLEETIIARKSLEEKIIRKGLILFPIKPLN